MAKFNLLPNKYQDSFKQEIFSRMFLIGTVFALLWALVFSTTIVAGIVFLSIQNDALEDRIASMNSLEGAAEAELAEQDVVELNLLLSRVSTIKKESAPDSLLFLDEIASAVPSGAYITSYSFDAKTNLILINGSAESLSQYNILENRIEESPLFEEDEIDPPISNLIDPTSFKLTIPIKEVE